MVHPCIFGRRGSSGVSFDPNASLFNTAPFHIFLVHSFGRAAEMGVEQVAERGPLLAGTAQGYTCRTHRVPPLRYVTQEFAAVEQSTF